MNDTKRWYQSKTLNLNALYLALVMIVTQGFGIKIPEEVIVAVQTIMNFVLRVVTEKPITS